MFKYYFSQRGERLAHRDEQVSQCVTFPEAQLSVSLPVSTVSVSESMDVCRRLPPARFEVSVPFQFLRRQRSPARPRLLQ